MIYFHSYFSILYRSFKTSEKGHKSFLTVSSRRDRRTRHVTNVVIKPAGEFNPTQRILKVKAFFYVRKRECDHELLVAA